MERNTYKILQYSKIYQLSDILNTSYITKWIENEDTTPKLEKKNLELKVIRIKKMQTV